MILFTTDSEVLSLIADHDPLYQAEAEANALMFSGSYNEGELAEAVSHRPRTADKEDFNDGSEGLTYSDQRPFTTARTTSKILHHQEGDEEEEPVQIKSPSAMLSSRTVEEAEQREEKGVESRLSPSLELRDSLSDQCVVGRVVQLCLIDSWGDGSYVGVTGVELLAEQTKEPLYLREDQVTGEGEELAALVGGVNLTTDMENMCLFHVYPSSAPPTITITLDTPTRLFGMRVWNYNTSIEDTYKGVSLTTPTSTSHQLMKFV